MGSNTANSLPAHTTKAVRGTTPSVVPTKNAPTRTRAAANSTFTIANGTTGERRNSSVVVMASRGRPTKAACTAFALGEASTKRDSVLPATSCANNQPKTAAHQMATSDAPKPVLKPHTQPASNAAICVLMQAAAAARPTMLVKATNAGQPPSRNHVDQLGTIAAASALPSNGNTAAAANTKPKGPS